MITAVLALIAVAVLFAAAYSKHVGWDGSMIAALLVSLALIPIDLTRVSSGAHFGIASGEVVLTTFVFAVAGAGFVAMLRRGGSAIPRTGWTIAIFLLLGMMIHWQPSPERWAGVIQYLLAPLAWASGVVMGSRLALSVRLQRVYTGALAAIVVAQLLVALLQIVNLIPSRSDVRAEEDVIGRVSGTLDHPNNLGKVIFFIIFMALPMTRSDDNRTRYAASTCVIFGIIPIALTLGRAVFIAALALLVVWYALSPQGNISSRKGAGRLGSIAAIVVGLAFMNEIVARFAGDPRGGAREHFTEVALQQIPMRPLAGTGPNAYVTEIGRFDALTAEGWPVHNTFLLAAAELGIVGSCLLFAPLLGALFAAWRNRKMASAAGDQSRAVLAMTPGLLVIALTGYGLLARSILPLWFFAIATAWVQIVETEEGSTERKP